MARLQHSRFRNSTNGEEKNPIRWKRTRERRRNQRSRYSLYLVLCFSSPTRVLSALLPSRSIHFKQVPLFICTRGLEKIKRTFFLYISGLDCNGERPLITALYLSNRQIFFHWTFRQVQQQVQRWRARMKNIGTREQNGSLKLFPVGAWLEITIRLRDSSRCPAGTLYLAGCPSYSAFRETDTEESVKLHRLHGQ